MEETFDEKRCRYLVERFGVAKGNRVADEIEKPKRKKRSKRKRKEQYG